MKKENLKTIIEYYISRINFWFWKPKIKKLLPQFGLDWDGDIFTYKGKRYFVHYKKHILKRV